MAIVKDVIAGLKKLDPNDVIHISWLSKDDVINEILDLELVDENDTIYERDRVEAIVDNEFMSDVDNHLHNTERLWEEFSQELREVSAELFNSTITDIKENEADKELWEA